MEDDLTACSNCRCPINYDCARFEVFFNSKYRDINEFTPNQNYTCDDMVKKEEVKNVNSDYEYSLF